MARKSPQNPPSDAPGALSRRGFLKTVGIGAAAVAAGTVAARDPAVDTGEIPAGATVPVTLDVNGRERRVLVEPRWSLLFVLRERLGLTGTKVGCERGECGACTVLLDDEPRYACLTLAVEAEGRSVTTLEGLMDGERLGPVQEAFVAADAFQCGYCTPGQVMAVEGLLRHTPHPDLEQIRTGVSGNLCRCGAYAHIFQAAAAAAETRGKGGGR
ncbi:MAG: (2Fe-2S)-binding protein [Krumholzibacteria bacterium]|nr:(2Fe-2S)-binding protein [Candidatus Krumholzibacteria bacterium]